MQLPELLNMLDPHDAALLLLSALVALILFVLWRCVRRGTPTSFDPGFYDTDSAKAISQDEVRFWTDLRSGPCRLTDKQINKKAERLTKIRHPHQQCIDIPAFSRARREILQHVGRAG